jgi:hypothetical protein
MKKDKDFVAVTISLTEDQRKDLANDLGINIEFVPDSLGVVGMPKYSRVSVGLTGGVMELTAGSKAKFSPALVML